MDVQNYFKILDQTSLRWCILHRFGKQPKNWGIHNTLDKANGNMVLPSFGRKISSCNWIYINTAIWLLQSWLRVWNMETMGTLDLNFDTSMWVCEGALGGKFHKFGNCAGVKDLTNIMSMWSPLQSSRWNESPRWDRIGTWGRKRSWRVKEGFNASWGLRPSVIQAKMLSVGLLKEMQKISLWTHSRTELQTVLKLYVQMKIIAKLSKVVVPIDIKSKTSS